MRSLRLHLWILAGACGFGASPAPAQLLSAHSPFLPPNLPGPAIAAEVSLEYLGFIRTTDGDGFRVIDKVRKRAAFLKLNEADPELGVIARHFDAANDVLVVERDGRAVRLPERRSRIRSSGGTGTPPPPAGPTVSSAVIRSVVTNPTPQQEAVRLQAIVDEIKRRRDEREKAGGVASRPVLSP